MSLKKILIYSFVGIIVLMGLSMFHGGIRQRVTGNFNYYNSIRGLEHYELVCSDNERAAFDGQIAELLKIPRMDPYSGEMHELEGELIQGNNRFEITFSPVGMYADHWQEKPSMRVSVFDQPLENGVSEFGFLRPLTRDFLGDWIAGILSEDAGLINLKREIVAVSINGESRNAYLLEETFRGYSNRKEKAGFALKYSIVNDTCSIKPYNDKISNELILSINAKMTQIISDPSSAGELFDLKKMAKFYLINDLTQGFHQFPEFNTHFFYNYSSGLLEPIGREWNSSNYLHLPKITTEDYLKKTKQEFVPSLIHVRLFENEQLKTVYASEQQKVKIDRINAVLKKVDAQKEQYVRALWKDMGVDFVRFDYLLENVKFIQSNRK